MRAWPRVTSAALASVPVLVLAMMVANTTLRSVPAVTDVGLRELASTRFSSLFLSGVADYGLAPALWGSTLLLVIALSLALPISLSMAIFSTELAPTLAGRAMRVLLGVFSGIPPIVYALMAVVFVAPFMVPKFTGNLSYSTPDTDRIGVAPENWPPAGVPWNPGAFPWDPTGANNSVLLGGMLLALLAIPFMAPLIEDALRNVPTEPKQASLALGADRWQTLRRVTLPRALPGIISATRLGALKVLGDVMIALFVIGYSAPRMPAPSWDILERTAPLTATGAGLIGGLGGPESCARTDCDVGYFSALVLLVLAAVVVALSAGLEKLARRRMPA